MSVFLLDVNVLVSLLDSAHQHHSASFQWFLANALSEGWATCPLTENGFIRVVSQVSYPNLRLTPAMAADSLMRFKANFRAVHRFWPAEVSLADPTLFDLTVLTGSRQTTDAYLAGLAFFRKGKIATTDTAIPWQAVLGADQKLVERIATTAKAATKTN